MINYNPDLRIFSSTKINDKTYFSGFSTSDLGDARNLNTFTDFFNQQNIPYKKLVILQQIHSTNIEFSENLKTEDKIEMIEDTDGVITKNAGVILTIRNADCVPLLFVDKSRGIIGITHQGWRGSLKKMAAKMVSLITDAGAKKDKLIVVIGPAIGACCYDVNDDLYYNFLEEFDGYSNKVFMMKKGRWHLNLAHLNYLQLVESGVKKENIDFFPFCTKCDNKRFFSRRRSGTESFEEMFNFVMKLK